MSALVISEIFKPFVNTLTPDDKYSCRHMQTFWQTTSNAFFSKRKGFYSIFYGISEMCNKFRTFWQKKEEYPNLIITAIIASERDIYLSV